MTRTILMLMLALAMTDSGRAMSTYTDQWMSGTKLYASASTDTDGEDETASVDVRISGPSGNAYPGYWCTWYHASTQTWLNLTTSGEHTVESNHWTQSIAAVTFFEDIEFTRNVFVNYAYNGNGGIDWCSYNVSCPGAGGGSTPICDNAPSSITQPKTPALPCGSGPYTYGYVEWYGAVKLPILTNRTCVVEENRGVASFQHVCTAP